MAVLPLFNDPGFIGGSVPPGWGVDAGTLLWVPDDNCDVSAKGCIRWTNAVNTGGIFANTVNLPLSTVVVVSLYAKNLPGGNNDTYIQIRESSGFSSVAFAHLPCTSSWARYELSFTTHASIPGHICYFMGWAGAGFDLVSDAWQIETGSVASPYGEPGFGAFEPRPHARFGPF